MTKFIKSFILLISVWTTISCTNADKEQAEKQAKNDIPSVFNSEKQIFETNKKGEKIRQVFILKGNKLYETKNGITGKLLFVREEVIQHIKLLIHHWKSHVGQMISISLYDFLTLVP